MYKQLFISLFFISTLSLANNITLGEIESRLAPDTLKSSGNINDSLGVTFYLSKFSNPVRKFVRVFAKNKKDISQLAFTFYICNSSGKPANKLNLLSKKYLEEMTDKVLKNKVEVPISYISKLKTNEKLYLEAPARLKSKFSKVRIISGYWKCDRQRGRGYRLDLFTK